MRIPITKKTQLNKILELGKPCKRCGHCCRLSTGFISKNEIKKLAKHFNIKEKEFIKQYTEETTLFNNIVYKFKTRKLKGKPFGKCIFYSTKKGCTIQSIKPLHCRIGNCNEYGEELSAWFTVNYLVNPTDPESVRQFAVYIKTNGKTIPGGELKDLIKDPKLLKKILEYDILR